MKKTCCRCGITKIRKDFRKNRKYVDGFVPWCKDCITFDPHKFLIHEKLPETIEAERKWVEENQRYDILSIYGRVKLKQNLCKECNSRFFVLSPADDSPYCSDCREEFQ